MTTDSTPIVSLRDIHHEGEDCDILSNESWTIHEGENWVLMGANGSGKTTLLRILTGYLQPTSGTIETLKGRVDDEHGWFDRRQHIGVVSSSISRLIEDDQFAGDVVLTGREGILNFWEKPEPEDVQKCISVLKQIDAWHLKDRAWEQLSQGERQRILIGRALMNEAKLLVLDEPCAGLDPVAREHFLAFLENFMRAPDAPTVILVTHHVEEITPAFTHGLLLKSGKTIASGPIPSAITSATLSNAFGATVDLTQNNGRFRLSVPDFDQQHVF